MNIKWIGANASNYTVGRQSKSINKIILHWIVGTLESADKTFADGRRQASAHYGVGESEVHQYVKDVDTAWHAGNWPVNLESIGIEHEGGWLDSNNQRVKPSENVHKLSAKLVADLCKRYSVPCDRAHILKHKEVSDKPTECCGTLDVDLIIKLANELLNPKDPCEDMQNELIEMRASRDKWKADYKELSEKYTKEIQDKDKFIKQLQDTQTGLNTQIMSANNQINQLSEQLKKYEGMEQALVDSRRDIEELQNELKKIKDTNPLSMYGSWELIKFALLRK